MQASTNEPAVRKQSCAAKDVDAFQPPGREGPFRRLIVPDSLAIKLSGDSPALQRRRYAGSRLDVPRRNGAGIANLVNLFGFESHGITAAGNRQYGSAAGAY